MKIKYYIIILFIVCASRISYGQDIDVNIENISYTNGIPINQCGTIDFEDNSTVNLNIDVKIEKPINMAIGTCFLKIYTKQTTFATKQQHFIETIQSVNWAEENGKHVRYLSAPVTLDAVQFNISGGRLYASLEYSNSLFENSCLYDIVKDEVPIFELDPSSIGIPCASSTPVTFTVTNVYNSPGNLEYEWSVGSGWIYNGNNTPLNFTTTTDNITLTPLASPPNNVSVVPVLDNVSYNELTANVNLGSYNPSYPITGPDAVCSTATYTIGNLPSGTTVQSWSTSNTNIATVTTLNATQAELTAVGTGNFTLTATVANACGQTANIDSDPIFVGNPSVSNTTINGGHNNVSIYSSSQLSVAWSEGATGYYWFITTINSNCPSGGVSPKFQTGSGSASTLTTTSPFANVLWGTCTGDFVVNCRAINACGSSDYTYKAVTVFDPDGNNNPCDDFGLRLKSNPIKAGNVGIIMYRPAPGNPCDDLNKIAEKSKSTSYQVTLYSFKGHVVHSQKYKTEHITLENLKLKSGMYYLNITSSDGITKRKTLVVK